MLKRCSNVDNVSEVTIPSYHQETLEEMRAEMEQARAELRRARVKEEECYSRFMGEKRKRSMLFPSHGTAPPTTTASAVNPTPAVSPEMAILMEQMKVMQDQINKLSRENEVSKENGIFSSQNANLQSGGHQGDASQNSRGSRLRQRFKFNDIGMTTEEVFDGLMARGMITPARKYVAKPSADITKYCRFHQGHGHTTNGCITLKKIIQGLVDKKKIVPVKKPNTVDNPLPDNTAT